MVRSRRFAIMAAFVAGVLAGSAVVLILASTGSVEATETWELLGRLLIGLMFLSIVLAYITLLATGAAQAVVAGRGGDSQRSVVLDPGKRVRRVLVSAGGGAHAQLGLQLAGQIVGEEEGELTLLRVVRPTPTADIDAYAEELRAMAARALGPDYPVHVSVALSESVVDAVVQEAARGYDLLVLGVSEELGLRRWLSSTIPERIIEQAPCPVIIVKHMPGCAAQVDSVRGPDLT